MPFIYNLRNTQAAAVIGILLAGCGGSGPATTDNASQTAAQTTALHVINPVSANSNATAASTVADATARTSINVAQIVQTVALPPAPAPISNDNGAALTISTATANGGVDTSSPFFKAFGNGRTCATCHQQGNGWSITPDGILSRFNATNGTDPLFQLVDGANSPNAAVVSLDQKRLAYSMLLTKGLIRVGIGIPAGAEFSLQSVDDPYGFASASELSLFRRPLPTTNLKFETSVMWDGRETATDSSSGLCIRTLPPAIPGNCYAPLFNDLMHQANSAVRGHAQATQDLTAAEQNAIANFEKSLFTTQVSDNVAGSLTADGAQAAPLALSQSAAYFGINDFLVGDYQTHAPFVRDAMTLFAAWPQNPPPAPPPPPAGRGPNGPPNPPAPPSAQTLARASIARGEALFNHRAFTISGVKGLNDQLKISSLRGSCTTCHSTPNSGTHSVPRFFDTGVAAATLRTPDMPLYTLKNTSTGEVIQTTDPGMAMQTGKWSDIGRVKVPSLRAIESRSPYFHNGSINDIPTLVRFYDKRFGIGFTPQEVADLSAFLKAL